MWGWYIGAPHHLNDHCRLSKDVLESVLSYTRGRDIHSVGVIFMQMVDGRDVMRQFSDPNEAVQAGNPYSVTFCCAEAYFACQRLFLLLSEHVH